MQPINLFDLATQQARWLSVRQSSVAGNIANINTPGYRATEVEPFEKVLNNTQVAMRATNAAHFGIAPGENKPALRPADPKASVMPSDNTVVLENELLNAGEVRRGFELNTAIVKAFHRMFLMSTKG